MVYDIVLDLCEPRGLTLEKLCNKTDIILPNRISKSSSPINSIAYISHKHLNILYLLYFKQSILCGSTI